MVRLPRLTPYTSEPTAPNAVGSHHTGDEFAVTVEFAVRPDGPVHRVTVGLHRPAWKINYGPPTHPWD